LETLDLGRIRRRKKKDLFLTRKKGETNDLAPLKNPSFGSVKEKKKKRAVFHCKNVKNDDLAPLKNP